MRHSASMPLTPSAIMREERFQIRCLTPFFWWADTIINTLHQHTSTNTRQHTNKSTRQLMTATHQQKNSLSTKYLVGCISNTAHDQPKKHQTWSSITLQVGRTSTVEASNNWWKRGKSPLDLEVFDTKSGTHFLVKTKKCESNSKIDGSFDHLSTTHVGAVMPRNVCHDTFFDSMSQTEI